MSNDEDCRSHHRINRIIRDIRKSTRQRFGWLVLGLYLCWYILNSSTGGMYVTNTTLSLAGAGAGWTAAVSCCCGAAGNVLREKERGERHLRTKTRRRWWRHSPTATKIKTGILKTGVSDTQHPSWYCIRLTWTINEKIFQTSSIMVKEEEPATTGNMVIGGLKVSWNGWREELPVWSLSSTRC